MGFSFQDIVGWFHQVGLQPDMILQYVYQYAHEYAYQPLLVYTMIIVMMLLSGFGLPLPEELYLISAGLVCNTALQPHLYPPPYVGATAVNPYVTAGVAFFAVMFSDSLVFLLGKFFGSRLLRTRTMARHRQRMDTVGGWTRKYGMWAAGAFRFTPGLRFPGHFACGMMGLSFSKFVLIDAIAALISVPTQVLLIAFYGNTILAYLKEFKFALLLVAGVALLVFALRKLQLRLRTQAR